MRQVTKQEEARTVPTTWHLCWQAAHGREFFAHSSLHDRIRDRLIAAHGRAGRVLVDYALLPTEIHALTVIPPGDSAGAVARAVGSVVARWVRAAEPLRSPVLAGPYRAYPIGSPAELRNEVRMLAWRPVFKGLCATPTHYPRGALRGALGLSRTDGFDVRPLLGLFGVSILGARSALRGFVRQRPSEQAWRFWELTRGLTLAAGSASNPLAAAREVQGAAAALVAAGGPDGIDGALLLLEIWIAGKLGVQVGNGPADISRAIGARGRALVACLAVEHGVCSAAAVARHYRRAKATLSEQMNACRSREADRQIIATPVDRLIAEALALVASRSMTHGK